MGFTKERQVAGHMPLGYHPQSHYTFQLSDVDRNSGLYVIGKMGTGKSGFLQTFIYHDILQGAAQRMADGKPVAVIVIDPHGDLVDDLLAMLPPEVLIRVSVLDMEDELWPMGCNLFAEAGTLKTEIERSETMERIYHIFEVLWPEIKEQQYLPTLLKSAITVFLDNPGVTLVDMMKFFRDPAFRASLMVNVKDRTVVEDFEFEFERLKPEQQSQRVAPLMNRLRSLFVGRSLVRNILGQRHQSLDFRKAIDRREIIFIKLPTTRLQSDAQLLGTILLAQISAALFSYADTPKDQRPGVSIYVDEVANFATPDFKKIFAEGRKFGSRITIAHQWLGQLPIYLQEATAGARTTVCFRVNPEDATALARRFPAPKGDFEPSTSSVRDLLLRPSDFPQEIQNFVEFYLRKLPKSGQIEIKEAGMEVLQLLNGSERIKVHVDSPIMLLNTLFYEVMKNRSPHLPIPPEILRGLANGGEGFFPALRWASPEWYNRTLSQFPHHLVGQRGKEFVWLRYPEGDKEWFLHCLYSIRMTMAYLAEHPIGKETSASNKTAEILTQLPPRTACVVSGDASGTIYTFDTAPQLQGPQRTERFRMIRDQTRARYCAKRDEVNDQPPPDSPTSPVSPKPTAPAAPAAGAIWQRKEAV